MDNQPPVPLPHQSHYPSPNNPDMAMPGQMAQFMSPQNSDQSASSSSQAGPPPTSFQTSHPGPPHQPVQKAQNQQGGHLQALNNGAQLDLPSLLYTPAVTPLSQMLNRRNQMGGSNTLQPSHNPYNHFPAGNPQAQLQYNYNQPSNTGPEGATPRRTSALGATPHPSNYQHQRNGSGLSNSIPPVAPGATPQPANHQQQRNGSGSARVAPNPGSTTGANPRPSNYQQQRNGSGSVKVAPNSGSVPPPAWESNNPRENQSSLDTLGEQRLDVPQLRDYGQGAGWAAPLQPTFHLQNPSQLSRIRREARQRKNAAASNTLNNAAMPAQPQRNHRRPQEGPSESESSNGNAAQNNLGEMHTTADTLPVAQGPSRPPNPAPGVSTQSDAGPQVQRSSSFVGTQPDRKRKSPPTLQEIWNKKQKQNVEARASEERRLSSAPPVYDGPNRVTDSSYDHQLSLEENERSRINWGLAKNRRGMPPVSADETDILFRRDGDAEDNDEYEIITFHDGTEIVVLLRR